MKQVIVIGALLLLAGCGSSGDDDGAGPIPPPVPDTADQFVAQVALMAASAADDTDPAIVDAMATTAPETSEPVPQ
jgi:hypothetical protein